MRKEKSVHSDLKKSLCRIWCVPFPPLQCAEALQIDAGKESCSPLGSSQLGWLVLPVWVTVSCQKFREKSAIVYCQLSRFAF